MTGCAPDTLAYCDDLSQRTERLRRLYNRQAQDEVFAIMEIPRRTLVAFGKRYPAGPCQYPAPEERARFWDAYWKESASVLDDRVPAAYLSELDQGLYGGLVGGKARFIADPDWGYISSMVPPLLSDWKDFDSLRWDEEGEWARRYAQILDVFVRASCGRYGISHFILVDSLNFVFELLGATRTYLALEEEPERVRQAIEFAFVLNAWVQDRFFGAAPLLQGGTCSNMASWVPGKVVSESLDPFHMTSVDYLLKWGVAPVERILARYDGGVLHIHGNGRHLIEAACRIQGVRGISLGDDRGFPSAFDILPEIRRRAGEMPLIVNVPFPKFIEALRAHRLVGGVLHVVTGVPDRDSANKAMDEVRG